MRLGVRPASLSRWAKSRIRRLTRSLGYEIVPASLGLDRARSIILERVQTAVDVGANVGQFAERLRDYGFDRRIISFEPGTGAFRALAARAEKDPLWEARRCALGAAPGSATLHVARNSVSSSMLDVAPRHVAAAPGSYAVTDERVRVSTLDDELPDPTGELFLKLDVQGTELDVLRGAKRVLDRTRAIQTEVSFDALYDDQTPWLDLCRHLQDRDFRVRAIEPGFEDGKTGEMLQADLLFVRASPLAHPAPDGAANALAGTRRHDR